MQLNKALTLLNVDVSHSPEMQLKAARRQFLIVSMIHHPDKNGDAALFMEAKDAWELVHATLVKEHSIDGGDVELKGAITALATLVPAKESVPPYCIETAIRKRLCQGSKQPIQPGEPCLGFRCSVTGHYRGWRRIAEDCLKVPSRLHKRLTALDILDGVHSAKDQTEAFRAVLLSSTDVVYGLDKIASEHLEQFLKVVMNRNTWSLTSPELEVKLAAEAAAEAEAQAADAAIVPANNASAIVPLVEIDTAQITPGALRGKVIVTTGKFPLPGTSPGLNQGKAEVKAIIEQAGGKNPGSLSGKTTHLLVGTKPGPGKVDKALALNIKPIGMPELLQLLRGVDDKNIVAISTDNLELSDGFKPAVLQGPPAKMRRLM